MRRSPTLTNSGTWTTAPVSSVAGFVTLETVSPFTPGSVSVTASSSDEGVFMDPQTYDQIALPHAAVEDALPFMLPSSSWQLLFVNEQPASVDLPSSVVLEVADTEPGVKGDTVSNVTKPATLETGAVVQVPLFVNEGDRIKVDTREGRYLSRA